MLREVALPWHRRMPSGAWVWSPPSLHNRNAERQQESQPVVCFAGQRAATALARLGAPTADELGFAKALGVAEIGGTTVVVLEQDASAGAVSTVVLRASTDQLLDDLERAIDDGVNTYKVLSTSMASLKPFDGQHCMMALL